MPMIPPRIASAFAILCGHYGDVTRMAWAREQSRQSLYREAEQVIDAVDGATAHAQIAALPQQLAQLRAAKSKPSKSVWSKPLRSPRTSRRNSPRSPRPRGSA